MLLTPFCWLVSLPLLFCLAPIQTPKTGLRHPSRRKVPESDARNVAPITTGLLQDDAHLFRVMPFVVVDRIRESRPSFLLTRIQCKAMWCVSWTKNETFTCDLITCASYFFDRDYSVSYWYDGDLCVVLIWPSVRFRTDMTVTCVSYWYDRDFCFVLIWPRGWLGVIYMKRQSIPLIVKPPCNRSLWVGPEELKSNGTAV